MRFILALALGLGAAAMASVAPARPGGGGQGSGQGGGGLKVGWSSGGGHHAGRGGQQGWGTGPARLGPRHGPHHRRSARQDFQSYGGGGIVGPVSEVNAYGNGFFTGGGGRIRQNGDRPIFDYDRSYPYQWSSVAGRGAASERTEEAGLSEPRPRCTFENEVRVCRGW